MLRGFSGKCHQTNSMSQQDTCHPIINFFPLTFDTCHVYRIPWIAELPSIDFLLVSVKNREKSNKGDEFYSFFDHREMSSMKPPNLTS